MRHAQGLVIALAALAACKGSDAPVTSGQTSVPATTGSASAPGSAGVVGSAGATSARPADDLAQMKDLANTGHKQKFPDADAYVALDRDDITFGADGSVVHHHKSIVKILDAQRGKEKFADVHIPFDSSRQSLTLQVTRTVNADGVAHDARPEEIGDIVPPRLADATVYSDARERVVSFPAVDTGSVVELEYTRTTKAGPDAPDGGELPLARWNPIGARIVTVSVPENAAAPKLAVLGEGGSAVHPTESTANGLHTFTYEIHDLPDRHDEAAGSPDATVLPRLVYSFLPDWKSALAPIADRFLAVAVPATPDPAVKAQADQLVAGIAETDKDARAAKLYAFVTQEIRTIDLPLGMAGYAPHAPATVLANRYGDSRDKVALLLALAAAEGISGTPVFVRTRHVKVEPSVPTVAQFDDIIGKLNVDGGKEQWFDPSAPTGRFGVALAGQDNLVLPIVRGGAELGARPPLPPESSSSHTTVKLALAADGSLDAQYSYQLTGSFAIEAAAALRPLAGENLTRFFQSAAGDVAAGAVDAGHQVGDLTAVTGPLEISHHVTVPGYAQAEGNVRVVELPRVSLDAARDLPSTGLSERKTPLFVGTPTLQTADVTVQIPAGWKVSYVPPEATGTADGLTYKDACSAAGQTVTCHTEVSLGALEVSSEQYPAFRDAFAKLHAYDRRVVVLTKA